MGYGSVSLRSQGYNNGTITMSNSIGSRSYSLGVIRYSGGAWYFFPDGEYVADGRIGAVLNSPTSGTWNILSGDYLEAPITRDGVTENWTFMFRDHTGKNGVTWNFDSGILGDYIAVANNCSFVTPTPALTPSPSPSPSCTPQTGVCCDIVHWYTATETSLYAEHNANLEEIEYSLNHVNSACLDDNFALAQGQLGVNSVLLKNMTDNSVGFDEVVKFSLQSSNMADESIPLRCLDTEDFTFEDVLPGIESVSWTDATNAVWRMVTFNYGTEIDDNTRDLRLQRKKQGDTWYNDVMKFNRSSGFIGVSGNREFEPDTNLHVDGSEVVEGELKVLGVARLEGGTVSDWNILTTDTDVSRGDRYRTRNTINDPQVYTNFQNGREGQIITIFVDDVEPAEGDVSGSFTTFYYEQAASSLRLNGADFTLDSWRPDGQAMIQFTKQGNIWYEISHVLSYTDEPGVIETWPFPSDDFSANWSGGENWADDSWTHTNSSIVDGHVEITAGSSSGIYRGVDVGDMPGSVSIDYSISGAASYKLVYRVGSGAWKTITTGTINSTSWSDSSYDWTVPSEVTAADSFDFGVGCTNGTLKFDDLEFTD